MSQVSQMRDEEGQFNVYIETNIKLTLSNNDRRIMYLISEQIKVTYIKQLT